MTVRLPKYQLHKATGQARVRFKGRDIYLGKYRSRKSEERYRQVIADWLKTRTKSPARIQHDQPEPQIG